ncbi:protein ITPRID2-like isoform X1 [Acipenser ruthenus]|uniref:protein ITPRID2-like isoform X1 n=1 Tax=Acipenser ruthenus TaxID=7906 RepID=UPI00274259DC|nr:protein ITPRID2-like isoform X1 [Acipenser ruthenus]XP_033876135.3 protein ITPRID2-like isoform X1 [Acipenser ruthenus]XP_033876145.3 protein ITPRID2-like isoform X1 [Acipenser ruthenus]XP_033876156.3 protein ITPRID2-like isoform X1 [Acipenser ruthenus]XP_033876163.3 protein ITPRID2-like isoform X1 [Acipenser ruthenus]XP_058888192.1 protein ITPRID2-like isoform X1 [Acipenser ruthenus]XP_058888193.1 protein ITPRID2-like isoform X1 [Acipenser ruthenus]XP_058888194.1 protein ITPRID2-like iso
MEDSVADSHSHPWKVATEKRKAWARSRDSWQTSESVDVATEEQHSPGSREEKLPVSVDSGGIPNENIAIWLKDCRTPLGASLDDQNNSALKGIIKNGGSFEDDLSLGAEANHLRPTSNETGFGMLAKDKRNRFHQKGRSMNSTGSGKSSTTLSSVSELLDLYEEDPEEILYNLGFGTEEPDIASKIPSRFFNSTSGASGIDIKVYLDAQIQRMEVENPNYALTSRFRQIEVLTTVANAFSSLYSQVSGLPLQKIGNGATLPSENEGKDVPPFKRSSSALNAASKLKKTISRRSLHGAPQPGTEVNSSTAPASTGKENAVLGTEANTGMAEERNEQKLQKPLRKKDSPSLETVKEEAPVGLCSTSENGYLEFNKVSRIEGHGKVGLSDESSFTDSSLRNKDLNASTDGDLETNYEHKPAVTSTPDKEPSSQFQNPLLAHVFSLQKDSFEMEEIQSNEGEATSGTRTTNSRTEQLLRAVSQHSDSSGFAEDPSVDCASNTHLQVQESYDSCDSETTVTSNAEDIRTPLAVDQPVFWKLQGNEDVLKPSTEDAASLSLSSLDKDGLHITDAEAVSVDETPSLEGPNIRETESASEDEIPPYILHQIPKAVSHPTEGQDITAGEQDLPSTSDKVRFALCRAQLKACNVSDGAACMKVKARDLLQEKRELDLRRQSFLSSRRYPLIRSRSLPTSLLSPIRVVSSVKVRLSPGSETQCSPPSFTYKYTPEEDESIAEEEEHSTCTSTLFISPASQKKEPDRSASGFESGLDGGCNRIHSYPMHMPLHMSQSACSLHSINSSCYDRPLSEHMRTWSTSSVPNLPPYGSQEFPYSYSCPYPPRPVMYPTRPLHPPSTIEMQLRRVLHEIRNTVQNLAQNPALRGNESPASMYSSQRSVLPLYENTFQELQIMRKSLNVFGTQMMDLELSMMRQQIEVYPHLTEEERQEADQLQSLRTAVRQELQELELQLEDRLLTLEGQIRSSHHASLYRPEFGMQGSRSMDCLSCSSPVNVIEPVTELLREQLHLKSELGYEDPAGDYCSSATPSLASEASSGASSPSRKNRNPSFPPRQTQKPHAPDWSSQKMECYRASVSLTPSAPVRPGMENHVQEDEESVVENLRVELAAAASLSAEKTRRHMSDSPELQQVLKEIKETLAEEIRREIVNELVAAVSSPSRSPVIKREMS